MLKKILKSILIMMIISSSFWMDKTNVLSANTIEITLHYQRSDQTYTGWNVWAWPEAKDGASFAFTDQDSYGKIAKISMDASALKVGFIIRLNEWEEKDITVDRFIDLKDGKAEIWLKSDDPMMYTSQPSSSSSSTTTIKPSVGKMTLNLHYKRYDAAYTGWNIWLWQEGKDGMALNFGAQDAFGKIFSTSLQVDPWTLQLGMIMRLNEWQAKDIDKDRFINLTRAKNNILDVWVVQGDETLYYDLKDIDLSPKFLSASLDSIDMVSVKTTQPIDIKDPKVLDKLTLKNSKNEVIELRLIFPKEGVNTLNSSNFTLFTQSDLDLMERYTLSYPGYADIQVNFKSVFASEAFESKFTTLETLGMTYTPTQTNFKLWAPTASDVRLKLYKDGNTDQVYTLNGQSEFKLQVSAQGVWSLDLTADLKNVYYTYVVTVNGDSQEAVDPYAKAVGVNGLRGMVVDLDSTDPSDWNKDTYVELKNSTDAIVYELHIRDFSSDPNSGITAEFQGKYLAFTQTGTQTPDGYVSGIDYLKSLGITHVHLLPSFDFRSIDETQLENNNFNWGYDPQHFNVPEGSYSSDPYDGNKRITEFKQMVQALHEANIGVVMDVVYNHTGASNTSDFSKVVPGYYYRYNENGTFSNGSGTGNETASDRAMVQRYIIDSVKYWTQEYHIDGFRFDLMALHDIETMNALQAEVKAINPSALLYGEGWTGGSSPLPDNQKALKVNVAQLENIAVFSDDLRDALKGHVFSPLDPGYVNGAQGLESSVKFGIVASIQHPGVKMSEVKYTKIPYATSPTQIMSYVEAHDNLTLWDRLLLTNPNDSDEVRIAMHRLANAIVLTSQGTSFIHAGAEFLRTKEGNDNSYNATDDINQLDWLRRGTYDNNVQYFQGLIELRKEHSAFRMTTADENRTHLAFIETDQSNVIGYQLKDNANKDAWENIVVLMNSNPEEVTIQLEDRNWVVVVNQDQAGVEKLSTIQGSSVVIPAYTLMVLVDASSYGVFPLWGWFLVGAVVLVSTWFVYKKIQLKRA